VNLSRFLPADCQSEVDKCLQRNGFFGHPENLLLVMLADDSQDVRKTAVDKVLLARQVKCDDIRTFTIPLLNFDAENYHSLINWDNLHITEPPVLVTKTDAEIESAVNAPQKWSFEDLPCHTQAVERHIRTVTEAAESVCGALRRDGYVRAKILSRKTVPHFGSKKDWNF